MKKDLSLLLSYTQKIGDCLEWTRALNSEGYARAVIDGNSNAKIHRVVWELYNKQTPQGVVRHSCDNRKCINPLHLLIGTPQDNVRDMLLRERKHSKIKPLEVKAIRDLYATNQYTQKQLGSIFGISEKTVNSLINYKHWKYVD